MRAEMGGYRPDVTMAASALLLDAVDRPEARQVIAEYGLKKFQQALNPKENSE